MTRNLVLVLLSLGLVFSVGCGKKNKGDKDASKTAVGQDGEISSKPMKFDTTGSDSGNIPGLNSITFGYDRANLSDTARTILKENAKWMSDNTGVTLQVEGHCDKRGSTEYNLALGERRAMAVKNYLVGQGVSSDRLSVISYGKERLLDLGDADSAHSRNRRANFVPIQ